MKRFLAASLVAAAAVSTSVAYDELPYTTYFDSDIQTGQTDTLYRLDPITGEQVYWSLQEQVIVDSGATLVIDSGALIFGNLGPAGQPAGALICAAGGQIIANGTEEFPIIMTAVGDDPEDPFDLGPGARNMWGGLIVLGNAQISNPDKPGESAYPGKHHMEGIPSDDPRAYYGSASDAYNNESSGIYRYISIRHGGSGDVSNEEVNGMTFGGVGSGTVVEHIEVFANADDAFEFFGGTVQTKYLVAAYCGDDHFDYDEGFRGKGQFWFAIHEDKDGDRGGEHDGYDPDDDDTLYSEPTIYNATYIGSGRYSDNSSQHGIYFRDYAGGHYNNLIISDFSGRAIRTGDIQPWGGALTVEHSIFYDYGDAFAAADSSYLFGTAPGNQVVNPQIRGAGREIGIKTLDPRVASTSPALTGGKTPPNDGFFDTSADFVGAFNSTDLWIDNWTAISEMGILSTYQGENPLRISPKGFIYADEYTVLKFYVGVNASVKTSSPAFNISVDGVDVTSSFLSGIQTATLADGTNIYYLIRSKPGQLIPTGGAPEDGPHTISATFPMWNGMTLRGESQFEILK